MGYSEPKTNVVLWLYHKQRKAPGSCSLGTLKKESIFAVHRTHNQDTSGLTNHTTHTTHKTAEPTTRGLKKMEASARGGIERAAHRLPQRDEKKKKNNNKGQGRIAILARLRLVCRPPREPRTGWLEEVKGYPGVLARAEGRARRLSRARATTFL